MLPARRARSRAAASPATHGGAARRPPLFGRSWICHDNLRAFQLSHARASVMSVSLSTVSRRRSGGLRAGRITRRGPSDHAARRRLRGNRQQAVMSHYTRAPPIGSLRGGRRGSASDRGACAKLGHVPDRPARSACAPPRVLFVVIFALFFARLLRRRATLFLFL